MNALGIILLAIYLILVGLLSLTNLQFEFSRFILGALALVAGGCLLLGASPWKRGGTA